MFGLLKYVIWICAQIASWIFCTAWWIFEQIVLWIFATNIWSIILNRITLCCVVGDDEINLPDDWWAPPGLRARPLCYAPSPLWPRSSPFIPCFSVCVLALRNDNACRTQASRLRGPVMQSPPTTNHPQPIRFVCCSFEFIFLFLFRYPPPVRLPVSICIHNAPPGLSRSLTKPIGGQKGPP